MHRRSYSPGHDQGGQVCVGPVAGELLGTDEDRERYLGVRIPPIKVQDYPLDRRERSRDDWRTNWCRRLSGSHGP
jgi:hypothetical protein